MNCDVFDTKVLKKIFLEKCKIRYSPDFLCQSCAGWPDTSLDERWCFWHKSTEKPDFMKKLICQSFFKPTVNHVPWWGLDERWSFLHKSFVRFIEIRIFLSDWLRKARPFLAFWSGRKSWSRVFSTPFVSKSCRMTGRIKNPCKMNLTQKYWEKSNFIGNAISDTLRTFCVKVVQDDRTHH